MYISAGALGHQKRASDFLELELQVTEPPEASCMTISLNHAHTSKKPLGASDFLLLGESPA